jgi:alpha-methylacyl-CoA racemase
MMLADMGANVLRIERPGGTRPGVSDRLSLLNRSRRTVVVDLKSPSSETCFAPVLTIPEAMEHPHNRARRAFIEVDGVMQPAPAPRFSRSRPEETRLPDIPSTDTEGLLSAWGFSASDVAELRRQGAFG